MKKKQYSIIIIISALTITLILLLQMLLVPKYQTGIIEGSMTAEYYKSEKNHDVIMIGDCELYENISPVTLFNEYGISSYIRGSAQQLVWHSYYLLEDTLKYETPKAVVFNVLSLKYDKPQKETYNRMTIDGMRWGASKINCIRASMTEEEKFIEYLFPLLRYHSRWSELEEDDIQHIFRKDLVTHNGYYMRVDVVPQKPFPEPAPLLDSSLGENAMYYLDKMTKLCKEKGIELILIKAPIEYPHWYDEWDAQISDYAEENGLMYVNFIPKMQEIGLDMSVDTYDAGLHLNLSGAEKFSSYFGAWLSANLDLPDHRGEAEYDSVWKEKTEFYNEVKEKQYSELELYGELVSFGANAIKK